MAPACEQHNYLSSDLIIGRVVPAESIPNQLFVGLVVDRMWICVIFTSLGNYNFYDVLHSELFSQCGLVVDRKWIILFM